MNPEDDSLERLLAEAEAIITWWNEQYGVQDIDLMCTAFDATDEALNLIPNPAIASHSCNRYVPKAVASRIAADLWTNRILWGQ